MILPRISNGLRRTALVFGLLLTPAVVAAQMTIMGRVTVGDRPVEGASVGIPSLRIETRTTIDGHYSLLVRASQIRGQVVTLTARHRRAGTRSVELPLTGGSAVRDFVLVDPETTAPEPVRDPVRVGIPAGTAPPPPARASTRPLMRARRTLDSTAFENAAGPLDVASALAGKIPGLIVTSASAIGGSAPMMFRGSRSVSGSAQPLVVLDGVPIDNAGFASAAQQVGFGGFDYGTPVHDVVIQDIASVTLLDPATAALLYGSRAANGVLLVATKQMRVTGLQHSVRLRYTMEHATRLPSYQNRYGQGLGGQFEFFDGMGGGINDDVDQSWGPALNGQPIPQASLTEPRRPDVRYWFPGGNGISDYLRSGRTYDAGAAVGFAREVGGVRLGVNARDANGLTPSTGARRLGGSLGAFMQPLQGLSARANASYTNNQAKHRPGTGYDEVNPIAGFTRFGRQVSLAPLRARITDGVEQINWIYTERNNPFFQTLRNANDDTRNHLVVSGALEYDFTAWLSASVRGGIDDVDEDRTVSVAQGWKGEYPTAIGRRDLSNGAAQKQTLASRDQILDASLATTSLRAGGFDLGATAGVESRTSDFRSETMLAGAIPPGGGPSVDNQSGKGTGSAYYLIATASRANYLLITGGARVERSSTLPASTGASIFPSLTITYDAAQTMGMLRGRLSAAQLRASWWRSGNEITRRTLSQTFVTTASATPVLGIPLGDGMLPERTTGIELGTEIASPARRVGGEFTYYTERSNELLITTGTSGTAVFTTQAAEVSNRGFELLLHGAPWRGTLGSGWDITASIAKNTNKVDQLANGLDEIPLSPMVFGAGLVARKGSPLGTIVGTRYLRDPATQALVLRNGLPIPDRSGALSVLGSWSPGWTASLASKARYGNAELAVLFDVRRGGKIFSATNLWGSYAGTLKATVDRENGRIVPGIDSITRAANATTVSAEDYFHALGAIHEAWVYDASYAKLREARLSYETPVNSEAGPNGRMVRLSLIGRNLFSWIKAPNIDPETALSSGIFQGFEMGQLPNARSIGLQLSIVP